jgi:hypothetical protein
MGKLPMAKTNLVTTYFRARLFEKRGVQSRSVFVWDFGQFATFNDFYNSVKGVKVNRDDCFIEFYVCRVGAADEVLLESINIPSNCQEVLNYEHPKRTIKRN